jgi:F0F1-type ATP synthase assembly protein I
MPDDESQPVGDPESDKHPTPASFASSNLPLPPEITLHKPTMLAKEERRKEDLKLMGEDQATNAQKLGQGMAASVLFCMSILSGGIIGTFIDHHFPKVSPCGIITFGILGVAAGFVNLYRVLGVYSNNKKR